MILIRYFWRRRDIEAKRAQFEFRNIPSRQLPESWRAACQCLVMR
jgi:hypothetical protein